MPPPAPRQISTRAMAGALGLLGPLSGSESRDRWTTPPSERESVALQQLRDSADFRLHNSSGAAPAHLRTALGWLRRFTEVFPGRKLFLPYSSSADVESAAGEVVLSCTISDYISAIRAFVSREAGYSLLVTGGNLRLDSSSAAQVVASSRLRLQVASRSSDRKPFSSTAGITLADVEWISPCGETAGYCVAIVDVLPIKNVDEHRVRVPMLIRRRTAGAAPVAGVAPEDGCAWTAMRRLYDIRTREVPSHLHGVAPLFASHETAVRTTDVLEFIREAADAAGEDPALFNARALRIGGATDLYHLLGAEEAERTIQKRGRWCSECYQVYTRMSATAMCSVSAQMADANGVDLEAFRSGYVMPAVVQRRHARTR